MRPETGKKIKPFLYHRHHVYCLEHGEKYVVKGQCLNCERPYSFYCFPAEMTKGKEREMHGFRLSNKKIQIEQNGSQKTVIGFVHYIL